MPSFKFPYFSTYLPLFISLLWIGYSFYFLSPSCGEWIEQENDGKWYVMSIIDEEQIVVGPFNSELEAEKSISICVSDFNTRLSKYGTIHNLLPFRDTQNVALAVISIFIWFVFAFGPPSLLYIYLHKKSKKINEIKDEFESKYKESDYYDVRDEKKKEVQEEDGVEAGIKKANVKEVYTNKELRETLESLNLNDHTIDSIDIKLYFKKWATYESDVEYSDMEYKGYKYELHGFLVEKWSRPELYYYYDDESDTTKTKDFDTLSPFLKQIQNIEISMLDNYLDFDVHGEPEHWEPINKLYDHIKAVKWISDTPNEIKDEFESKYKESDYYDVRDEDKVSYSGDSGHFFEENNNISSICLDINTADKNYQIQWLNRKVGYKNY